MKRLAKRIGGKLSIGARERDDLESTQRGMRAAFAGDDMGGLVGEDLVAGAAMHQRRRDVAHGAGRHEHRRLLAEQFGHALAQRVHGRIVADLFVADIGPCHGFAHRLGRAGLRVRQQIDADRR